MSEKFNLWKVSTRNKKSVVEVEIFRNGDQEISKETGWRWGYVTLIVPDGVDLVAELNPEANEQVEVDDLGYDIHDRDLDDGCWEEWKYGDLDSETVSEIEAAYEEDWTEGIENLGWLSWDGLLYFNGPLDVENLGEYTEPEYDEDEEEDDED